MRAYRARAAIDPHGGWTAGEMAATAERIYSQQRAEARALHPGSVVDTELRDLLWKTEYLRPLADRAAMLRSAQRLKGLRRHRVRVCLRYMSKRGPERDGERVVEVIGRAPADELGHAERVSYRGVVVCGNGWVCPVCASKITEGRRRELRAGVQRHRNAGGAVVLSTFTFSHGQNDELRPAWAKLGRAMQAFARSQTVKQFRAEMGFTGRIRSREITYGVNGWHPHAHALELYDGARCTEEKLDGWSRTLSAAWQRCCTVQGLGTPSIEHGFKVSLTDVDDYIAKWGIDAELTKWHIKRNRPNPDADGELGLNGYSPFDLLRIHAGELEADRRLKLGTDRAAALFTEYADSVKGTAQLHWSRGLKKTLGVDKLSDDELAQDDAAIAARDDEPPEVLGTLTASDWFTIVSVNKQVEFLGLVSALGFEAARLFIDDWRADCDEWRRRADKIAADERKIRWLWRPRL